MDPTKRQSIFKKGDIISYDAIYSNYYVVNHMIEDVVWFFDSNYTMGRSYLRNSVKLIADGSMFNNDQERFNYIRVLNTLE